MRTMARGAGHDTDRLRGLPTPAQVRSLARELLGDDEDRLRHMRTAGFVAERLAVLFEPEEADLLVTAASLHDIGYSPRIARTGFHPLDGGAFLLAEGFPPRLANLVANHSMAHLMAPEFGVADLAARFPDEGGLLADALAFADMHSAPDGRITPVEHRLADIAARHTDLGDGERAMRLRLAIARVSDALLDLPAESGSPALGGIPTIPLPRDGAQPLSARGLDDGIRIAFDDWWAAEAEYALECLRHGIPSEDPNDPETLTRDIIERLARLRSRADDHRDRLLGHATT